MLGVGLMSMEVVAAKVVATGVVVVVGVVDLWTDEESFGLLQMLTEVVEVVICVAVAAVDKVD